MIVLDRSRNDTSVALDLVRAAAAQIVCIGHALNFADVGLSTLLPNFGVVLFFLISGFVIAATLSARSTDPAYGPIDFAIDRFARIYTAFLPALLMIAIVDYSMAWALHPLQGDSASLRTLFGNLLLRGNLPVWPRVSTFGSAGHLTSVAIEFHIYFFVGAVFFLLKGRQVWLCAAVIVFLWWVPVEYSSAIPGTDRTLFIFWLVGFAVYHAASSVPNIPALKVPAALLLVVSIAWWIWRRTSFDYDLVNLPPLGIALFSLVVLTQSLSVMTPIAPCVRFFADKSYSLFLIHLTIIKLVYALPVDRRLAILVAVIVSNAAAVVFARAFEQQYRKLAAAIKAVVERSLLRKEPSPA